MKRGRIQIESETRPSWSLTHVCTAVEKFWYSEVHIDIHSIALLIKMKFGRSPRSSAPDVARVSKFSFTRLRILLFIVNFIKWASACIVMGVASYFIHDFSRNEHTTYQEVIACTSVAFFLPTIPLAFHKRFTIQLIPLDYIYSHLWLTAFIFAAEDYNWMNCSTHSPSGVHSCTLKYVLESWSIIAVYVFQILFFSPLISR